METRCNFLTLRQCAVALAGLTLHVAISAPATAQLWGEEEALKGYKRDIARKPFKYNTRGWMVLARSGESKPLQILMRDYGKPKALATRTLSALLVADHARYAIAGLLGSYYDNWTWEDKLAALRGKYKRKTDVWLWVNTIAVDGRTEAMARTVSIVKDADDILLRAAAIEAMAWRERREVLGLIPGVIATFPKAKQLGERRLLVGALSSAILAHKSFLKEDDMQKAIRAYIGLLSKDVKLSHSGKMVIARYLAKTIGKDRRYIEPEPWIQLLDQEFEPPKRAGNTVTTLRFFGIEAEGDRICYLVDMSNSMLKPIDPALLPKGPITGKKRKRKKGQLPTEDDIPWHLVKTRFDLARWHLKISMQRLTKDKRFCVVWFGDESGLFKATPGMIKASRTTVKKVIKELDGIKAGPLPKGLAQIDAPDGWLRGQTNMHGGLRRAFAMRAKGFADRHEYVDMKAMAQGCDTIFLLSDGAPSTDDFVIPDKDYGEGKVVAELEYGREMPRPEIITYHGPMDQPRWLRQDIRRMNVFRKVQIHCIGIGDADIGLLRGIASDSEGQVYLFGTKAKAAGRRRK
jgi:hypothetical protein